MAQMSLFNIWENIYATFFSPLFRCYYAEACMNYSCWGQRFSNVATARERIVFAFVVISEAPAESEDIQFSVPTDAVHEFSL